MTTVGVSGSSSRLVDAHRRVATDLAEHVDGLRLSFTPYTNEWVAGERDRTARAAFLSDFTMTMQIYRPLLDRNGAGSKHGVCVEMRFAPMLECTPVTEFTDECGRAVVACGPHVCRSDRPVAVPVSRVVRVTDGVPSFDHAKVPFTRYTSDLFRDMSISQVVAAIDDPETPLKPTPVAHRTRGYRFVNCDGPYWAFDPSFLASGRFEAFHVYPRSPSRRQSGYINATRHWLNELIEYKRLRGVARRASMPESTWSDVEAGLTRLEDHAGGFAANDRLAARHLREEVLPMVTAVARCMQNAGYPPRLYFEPRFLIDTGQVVNQGKARGLFRGLVSRNDEPMTPMEERGYGRAGVSSQRGAVWRVAPIPATSVAQRAATGGKNTADEAGGFVVQELDPRHLRPVDRETGRPLRTYRVGPAALEHKSYADGRREGLFPGSGRHGC